MNNLEFLDIITIISFIIGYENYQLNMQQSNQLENHLREQDNNHLTKIIQQNEELLRQNQELLELLKNK